MCFGSTVTVVFIHFTGLSCLLCEFYLPYVTYIYEYVFLVEESFVKIFSKNYYGYGSTGMVVDAYDVWLFKEFKIQKLAYYTEK